MDCTIISTKGRRRGGFTLMESIIAAAIGTVVFGSIAVFGVFAERSFYALGNYVQLDLKSRNALDTISRDIRQADSCDSSCFSSTNLTLLMTDPASGQAYSVNYNYDPGAQSLFRIRTVANSGRSTVVLTNCTSFAFSYFQRNPANGAWDVFGLDTNSASICKLVQIDWVCARTMLSFVTNSESIESARVVIRKD
jgi:type II secretory pathway component PulJ